MPSSSSRADRARPKARSWRSPTRAATGCRRPGDGVPPGSYAMLAPPVADSAHTTPPPVPSQAQRAAERVVSSNVGQNYPYTSETEAERSASIATLIAKRADLAGVLATQAT